MSRCNSYNRHNNAGSLRYYPPGCKVINGPLLSCSCGLAGDWRIIGYRCSGGVACKKNDMQNRHGIECCPARGPPLNWVARCMRAMTSSCKLTGSSLVQNTQKVACSSSSSSSTLKP